MEIQRRRSARSSLPHPQSTDPELAIKARLENEGFQHHVPLKHPRTSDGFDYDYWRPTDRVAIGVMAYRADDEVYRVSRVG